MADCNFTIDAQGVDPAQGFERLRSEIAREGGTASGSLERGSFSLPTGVGTFTGSWERVEGRYLVVRITRPLLGSAVSCDEMERKVKAFLGQAVAPPSPGEPGDPVEEVVVGVRVAEEEPARASGFWWGLLVVAAAGAATIAFERRKSRRR